MRYGTWKRIAACAAFAVVVAKCAREGTERQEDDEDDGASRTTVVTATASASAAAGTGAAWHFDSVTAGQPPVGFTLGRTGSGRAGRWVVRAAPDAPSAPNVLAQEDLDATDYRFPVAVADSPSFRDVRVSVRCKPVAGRIDRACGLVWRYVDENNYYIARANALENNVRLYYVQDGRRQQMAGWNGRVGAGTWHELRVDMVGHHAEVYFDGARVIDAQDGRFGAAGRVGLWTKADSFTLFDDLVAQPLGGGS